MREFLGLTLHTSATCVQHSLVNEEKSGVYEGRGSTLRGVRGGDLVNEEESGVYVYEYVYVCVYAYVRMHVREERVGVAERAERKTG